jgi:hypothetical protein
MKLLCAILSSAILLTGCYSHATLTADSPQSTYEVSFRLKDGTYVLSRTYERVENGYKVSGTRVRQNPSAETGFSGILLDTQIEEVVTNEFDTRKTLGGVLLGAGLVAVMLGVLFPHADWGAVIAEL